MNWEIESKNSSNVIVTEIERVGNTDLNKIKKQFRDESYEEPSKKILDNLELLLKGQKVTQIDLQSGFIGLAKQNSELLELNKKLNQRLEMVISELNIVKKEREEKAACKKALSNRKRLPKRDPINSEIYNLLIKKSEGPGYIAMRTRVALCLLTVTGIRISELLPLKVGQLETLLEKNWISIDRLKKGPANHKAFLTREGKKLVKDRKKDFELIFLMKEANSYVFTADSKPDQMLRRETVTKDVNKVMRSTSKSISSQPNITSHSFRVGYISQLWKDTKDIEFVRQSIGHIKIKSTSYYVEALPDEERQKIMSRVQT